MKRLNDLVIYAWVGEDDTEDTGVIGLKQGIVPAGIIPLVAMDFDQHKLEALAHQMEDMARTTGKKRYLCRFVMSEVVLTTEGGRPVRPLC